MEVLTIAVTGLLCIGCFLIGAKVGQKVAKGEDVELPTVNPIKAIQERRDKQEAEWQQNRIDAIMRNIESYDGTSMGQEDVPRG